MARKNPEDLRARVVHHQTSTAKKNIRRHGKKCRRPAPFRSLSGRAKKAPAHSSLGQRPIRSVILLAKPFLHSKKGSSPYESTKIDDEVARAFFLFPLCSLGSNPVSPWVSRIRPSLALDIPLRDSDALVRCPVTRGMCAARRSRDKKVLTSKCWNGGDDDVVAPLFFFFLFVLSLSTPASLSLSLSQKRRTLAQPHPAT